MLFGLINRFGLVSSEVYIHQASYFVLRYIGAWPVSFKYIDGNSIIPSLPSPIDNAGDVYHKKNHLNTSGLSAEPTPGRAPFLNFDMVMIF
jgi:hypothetical protein